MYDQNHSFDALESPPHDDGLYWARLEDGSEPNDPIEWRDEKWFSDIPVERYSGKDVRQTLEQQIALLNSVLAGVGLFNAPDDLPQKRQAQSDALKLARHFASSAARQGISVDSVIRRRRNAYGFYVVAQQLGLSFATRVPVCPLTETDRALMVTFAEQFPTVRADIEQRARSEKTSGEFTDWARAAIEEREKIAAKRQAREAGRKVSAVEENSP